MSKKTVGIILIATALAGSLWLTSARAVTSVQDPIAQKAQLIRLLEELILQLQEQLRVLSQTVHHNNSNPTSQTGQTVKPPALSVDSISPTSGGVGTVVTLKGKGFTSIGNTIY